jgi:hypothetical protein
MPPEDVYSAGTANVEAPEKKASMPLLRLGMHAVKIDKLWAISARMEGSTAVQVKFVDLTSGK